MTPVAAAVRPRIRPRRVSSGCRAAGDVRPARGRPVGGHPLQQRRQRRLPGGAHQGERQPREHEDDVRAQEIWIGVPAVGQEQHEVEQQSGDGRRTGEQPGGDEQPDGDLHQRDAHSGETRVGDGEGAQEKAAGSVMGEPAQLRADVGRGAGVQKARIAQLLDAAVDEGEAEEQPHGEQRPAEPGGLDLGPPPVRYEPPGAPAGRVVAGRREMGSAGSSPRSIHSPAMKQSISPG